MASRERERPECSRGDDIDPLRAALQRVDSWFAKHRPRFHAGLNPGAAEAELHGLPAELRVLLAWHNGQSGAFVGCFESHWFLMSAAEIRAVNLAGDVPFLDNDAGDWMCLDTRKTPAPVRTWHLDRASADIEAPSLAAWMSAFADDLEAGRCVEDPERGTLLRQKS